MISRASEKSGRGRIGGAGWLVLGLSGLVLAGCANYNQRLAAMLSAFEAHQMQAAAAQAEKLAKATSSGPDVLLMRLEQGTVLRAAGEYERSNKVFDEAEALIEEFDQRAEVSVSAEAGAMVTNLSLLPYRGYFYDRIMLSVYRALNALQMGDVEAAKVELRRAYERQNDAVAANARRIEEAQKEAEKRNVDIKKTQENERLKQILEEQYGDLDQYAVYGDYVNPFAEFLQGLVFVWAGADAEERERGLKALTRVAGMVPENPYIAEDIQTAEALILGKDVPGVTYVIFEAGLAPRREEIRVDLPLFLLGKYSGGVHYVGVAFPKLVRQASCPEGLEVVTEGGSVRTVRVADMDAVVAREFKNQLPEIVLKTIAAAAVKAAMAYGAYQAAKDNSTAGLIVGVVTTVYQMAMNQADLRTWRTLPKRFEYCRVVTPANRRIRLKWAESGAEQTVELGPGQVQVVYVRMVSPGRVPLISGFALK